MLCQLLYIILVEGHTPSQLPFFQNNLYPLSWIWEWITDKRLLSERELLVSNVLIIIWDWHLLTQAVKISLFMSQHPCTAVWFLRRLKIYSQCPGLAPCQRKHQIGISQESPLEVIATDSTHKMISQEAVSEIPSINVWGRGFDSVRFQQSLSDLLLAFVEFKTLNSAQQDWQNILLQ